MSGPPTIYPPLPINIPGNQGTVTLVSGLPTLVPQNEVPVLEGIQGEVTPVNGLIEVVPPNPEPALEQADFASPLAQIPNFEPPVTWSTEPISVFPLPTVISISPTLGSAAGGVPVTIMGTGFIGATNVSIGGVSATSVVVVSDTEITAVTPALPSSLIPVSVSVTTPGGTGILLNAYTSFSAPAIPSLPAGSALDLFIDSGRTVVGGALTQWEDLAHAIIFTPPVGFTGPTITATKFQQFDGQLWSLATNELSNVPTTLFAAGTPSTMAVSGYLTDAGGAISTAFRMGSAGKTRVFIGNTTFCYSDGVTNITNPQMFTGAPLVLVFMITPGTGTMAMRLNGWNVVYPYAMTAPAGTPTIDAGSSGIQIGNRDDNTAFFWHGYEEEVHGYNRILDAADLTSLETNQAAKLGLVGVNGYVSDSAVITFLGLGGQELVKGAYAATRFYTTATSITLLVQQNTTAGPSVVNLPELSIFVDGVFHSTYTVPTSVTPFPPNTTVLALDGAAHIVEIWDGPSEQATPVVPVAAVLIGIQDPTGATSVLPAVIPTNKMVVYGDSISLACGSTAPINGAFQQLRYLTGHKWSGRVSFFGTIGRQLFTDRSFDATFVDTATALVALAHEVAPGGIKMIWVQISLNDFVASSYASAAAWGADLATLVAAIHTLDATIPIVLQGAIVAVNENVPNASGYTLPNLRSQMAAVAAANPTFVSYVDASVMINGAPPVTTGELNVDGYHPTNAGYVTYNTWLIAALQFLGYPTA